VVTDYKHIHSHTHKQTNKQDRLQYTAPQLSAQCNNAIILDNLPVKSETGCVSWWLRHLTFCVLAANAN